MHIPITLKRIAHLSCLLGFFSLVACTTTVEETGRKQFNVLNASEEAKLGISEFQKFKQSKPISSNGTYNASTQRVASRITRGVSMPNAQWEFVVFSDPTPNAFALPGGKVGIHSGLFKVVQNDAQLAAVIGHEIAHVTTRHSGERISRQMAGSAFGAVVGEVLHRKTDATRAVTHGATQGAITLANLNFSRKQELEADQIGAIYMAKAGYDPRESVEIWKRIAEYKKQSGAGSTPGILSTHPLDSRRIAELENFMPQALTYYSGN